MHLRGIINDSSFLGPLGYGKRVIYISKKNFKLRLGIRDLLRSLCCSIQGPCNVLLRYIFVREAKHHKAVGRNEVKTKKSQIV